MRSNPTRRLALLDAAIEVLARDGARGLTFRAVDAEAVVPAGTASNYFTNRDDLFTQLGDRIYDRLGPDEATFAGLPSGPATEERYLALMRELVTRVSAFGAGHLALIELRLEARRRPALRAVLTERVRADEHASLADQASSGLPGDATTVRLLRLALNWLILERLTLPDLHDDEQTDALITAAVRRALADAAG